MRPNLGPFVLFLAAFQAVAGVEWSLCEHGALMNVTQVAVVPDPVQAGIPATFSITASLGTLVESGSLDASVSYFGVRVFSKTGDFCEAVGDCPLEAGRQELHFEESMPGWLPPGRMTLTLHAKGEEGANLFCVDIVLQGGHESQPQVGALPVSVQ